MMLEALISATVYYIIWRDNQILIFQLEQLRHGVLPLLLVIIFIGSKIVDTLEVFQINP